MAAAAATARLAAASLSLAQQQQHRQLPLQLQPLCLLPPSQSSCSSSARRPQQGLCSTHGSHLRASACGAEDTGRSSPPSPTCAYSATVISSLSTAVPPLSSASPRLSRSQKLKPRSWHSGDLNRTSLRAPHCPCLSGRRAGHHVVVAAGPAGSAAAAAAAAGAAAKVAGAASAAASISTGAGRFASISSSIGTGVGGGVVGSGIVGSSSAALIASALFTLCTAGVMPFYTLMLFAPGRPLTEKAMRSSLPYIVLGAAYVYLLALSWTPNTLRLMFASKYWLPELPGITQMFSSTLTVASAWIHLLTVDLFSARHVYLEGLQLGIETRHSIVLCLMFGPIGILCHSLTKAYTSFARQRKEQQKRNDKSYKGPSL